MKTEAETLTGRIINANENTVEVELYVGPEDPDFDEPIDFWEVRAFSRIVIEAVPIEANQIVTIDMYTAKGLFLMMVREPTRAELAKHLNIEDAFTLWYEKEIESLQSFFDESEEL